MRSKEGRFARTDKETVLEIARALSSQGKTRFTLPSVVAEAISLFDEWGLRQAVKRLANGKVPRLDGIPNEALNFVDRVQPSLLLKVFKKCLLAGVSSGAQKRQKLFLIPEWEGSDPAEPSLNQPLNMLNNLGEIYDRMVLNRLEKEYEHSGRMFAIQNGSRQRRSTLHAIKSVQDKVEPVLKVGHEP